MVEWLSRNNYQLDRCGSKTYRISPCPLQGCDGSEAFTVYPETNTYKCFSCNRSGSIFDILIHTGVATDISHALIILAKELNISLEKEDTEKAKIYKTRQEIWILAAEFYHQELMKLKPTKNSFKIDKKKTEQTPLQETPSTGEVNAYAYLRDVRNRSDKMIIKMKYGYATSRDGLVTYLRGKGISADDMIQSGLVRHKLKATEDNKDEGYLYDLFQDGVLVYPVYYHGKIADFICKDPQKREGKNYRLPSQYRNNNVIFYNMEALYKNDIILVEGPEDCNTILELGDYAVMATLGQLQDKQIEMLQARIHGKTLHLAFDTDKAAEKYIERIGKALGCIEDVRVMIWNAKCKDIDEYFKSDEVKDLPEKDRIELLDSLMSPEKETDIVDWMISKTPSVDGMSPKMAEGVYLPLLQIIGRSTTNMAIDRYLRSLAGIFGDVPQIHSLLKKELKMILNGDDEDIDNLDEIDKKYLIRENNCYYKFEKDNKKWISNFVLDIKEYVEIDEDMHYLVRLINSDGFASKPILLSKEQRINAGEFSATCAGEGSYYYNGSNGDLSYIWISEEHRAKIQSRTCYFQRFGFIPKHKVWLFGNCIYKEGKLYVAKEGEDIIHVDGIGYKTQHVNIYSGDQPKLYLEKNPSLEYIHQVIELQWQMWDCGKNGSIPHNTFKAFLGMGWVACVIYLHELCLRDRKFPYLLSFGPPGTGKSEAIQLIMNCFGFTNGGENWGESTNAGITDALEQLSSIGYWIEEFSNVVGASSTQQRKVEMLKNIYNRASTGKGGLGGKRQAKEVNAAIVMTGQDRPENQALLSRCVVLRKEKPTDLGTDAFYQLRSQRQKLSLVVRWLLENKTPESIKNMYEDIDDLTEKIKTRANAKEVKVDERTAFNLAFFAAGFGVFGYHKYDEKFFEWLVMEAITDSQRKMAEDMVFKFFNDIEVIFSENLYEVILREGDLLFLRYDYIYNEWIKNRRNTGMNESLSSGGLHDYMKKDPHEYYVHLEKNQNRKYFAGKQYRAIAVSISKLPSHIQDVVDDWKDSYQIN